MIPMSNIVFKRLRVQINQRGAVPALQITYSQTNLLVYTTFIWHRPVFSLRMPFISLDTPYLGNKNRIIVRKDYFYFPIVFILNFHLIHFQLIILKLKAESKCSNFGLFSSSRQRLGHGRDELHTIICWLCISRRRWFL